MLLVYHDYERIYKVIRDEEIISFPKSKSLVDDFQELSRIYPDELLIWCAKDAEEILNINALSTIFHHNGIMASYSSGEKNRINRAVGYVDPTPFVNINESVTYPSWSMSAIVGGVNTRVILNFSKEGIITKNFEFYLNLLARKGMWQGLTCYSEPLLLKKQFASNDKSINSYTRVFQFVRFHYKVQWICYLLILIAYYDKKLPLLAFFKGLFFSRSNPLVNCMEGVRVLSQKKFSGTNEVDIIIPSIGRKKYLYDVLSDLKAQTCLPHSIIIVEQNPLPESVSELDYLTKEEWPFEINHIFTHQAGACNARNLALDKITGDWVFFADDDIRIAPDFLEKALQQLQQYGQTATTFFCFRESQTPNYTYPLQWGTFGSGCSIVVAEALKELRFDMRYEFGFGEDADFGMQLRNTGTDVFYFPKPDILHLKAPVGGFRTKLVFAWEDEKVQPKPSPTVLLFQLKNLTLEQQRSEKVKLYLNFYKHQPIKNPLLYIKSMNQRWKVSRKWALKLLQHD